LATDRSTWKKLERRIAKSLGGSRAPSSGSYLSDSTDIEGVRICDKDCTVSVKMRDKLQVTSWWEECLTDANKVGKQPLLVVHEKARMYNLVVVDLKFFETILGNLQKK
jgi:hypothetical protein